jgi:hypothetical protein
MTGVCRFAIGAQKHDEVAAAHRRHHHVGDHEVGALSAHAFERVRSIRCLKHFVSGVAEQRAQDLRLMARSSTTRMMAIGSRSWSNRSTRLRRSLLQAERTERVSCGARQVCPLLAIISCPTCDDGLCTPDAAGRSLRSMAIPPSSNPESSSMPPGTCVDASLPAHGNSAAATHDDNSPPVVVVDRWIRRTIFAY